MKYRFRTLTNIAVLAGLGVLAGCSDNNDNPVTGTGGDTARLVTLGSDVAFFDAWRSALGGEYQRYGAGNPVPEASPGMAEADSDSAASTTGDGVSDDSSGSAGGTDFTTTNVQESGVDEADLVKNDGEFLYVLQNTYSGCPECDSLVDEPAIDVPTDGTAEDGIEPAPGGDSGWALRILQLQPDVPDAALLAEVPLQLNGYSSGMFLYKSGESRSILLSDSNYGYYDSWNYSRGWAGSDGALIKLDVSNPQSGTSTQRLEFDGHVISSRLIGDRLILATRYYPDIEGLDPYAYPTEADWLDALQNVDLSSKLPSYTRLSDGARVPMVSPSACFVANDVAEGNSWPDIITLAVFDADDLSLQSSTCFLGASETLYASPEAVYLATTRYQYDNYSQPPLMEVDVSDTDSDTVSSDEPMPVVYNDPRIDTDIHQFDLNGSQLQYAGTGRVSGHLGWNELQKPFRMSESNGDLRVVTMSDNQDGSVSPVNLTVLRPDGTGVLQTIGKLPSAQKPAFIGKPAEQLYASRFLGNRGYLVTFRSTDPLYVLDLTDPADPKIAGELQVEGYSEYLHPIDENYLLGIGMDAVPAPANSPDGWWGDGRDGGLVQGVKVSLYDVSNLAAPSEVDTLLLGQRGSYSTALYDHRAISILPPANGRVATRVAFGIDIAGTAEPARRPDPEDAWTYYDWRFNALHGIEVRTGSDAGLTLAGRLTAASVNDQGNFGYGSGFERVVMSGDSTWYIYGNKVRAADWNSLDNPGAAR